MGLDSGGQGAVRGGQGARIVVHRSLPVARRWIARRGERVAVARDSHFRRILRVFTVVLEVDVGHDVAIPIVNGVLLRFPGLRIGVGVDRVGRPARVVDPSEAARARPAIGERGLPRCPSRARYAPPGARACQSRAARVRARRGSRALPPSIDDPTGPELVLIREKTTKFTINLLVGLEPLGQLDVSTGHVVVSCFDGLLCLG